MYEKYFGFKTLPFRITPDPRFLYENPSCREAMASLCYGIEGRKGFIVITGEPGTGKTRLVKDFMQRASVVIRTAFIPTPKLTSTELLGFVLNDLGIVPTTQDRGVLTLQLKDYLIEQFEKRHIVALLVDEAQQLSNELLEELRLLSNLETNEDKLIQIVLLGQPELETRLDQPDLRQLKQRVALHCSLAPLKDDEVNLYMQARLKTAGFEEKTLFEPKAVEKIALYSKGIPRLINVICDNALITCYASSKKVVSAEFVEEVARDLKLVDGPPKKQLSVADQGETEGKRRIIDQTRQSALLQAPPAEFPEISNMTRQRREPIQRQRRLGSLAIGFVCGVLATFGVGASLYSQSTKDYFSQIAARIWDETHLREPVKTAAVEPGALLDYSAKDLKSAQPVDTENQPISPQEPHPLQESRVGENAAPITEASKTAPATAADAQNKHSAKNDNKKNEETIKNATKGSASEKSASDRLEFDIHRAIAKHAIKGVEVSVIDGTVFLGGRVDTENKKIAAAKAASNVPGVRSIRDRIIVNSDVTS